MRTSTCSTQTLLTEGRKKPTSKKPKSNAPKGRKAKESGGESEEEEKPVALAPKTVRNIH